MTKEQQKELIDNCIDRGKFVDYDEVSNLSHETIIKIEDILHRFNDTSARSRVNKVLKEENRAFDIITECNKAQLKLVDEYIKNF